MARKHVEEQLDHVQMDDVQFYTEANDTGAMLDDVKGCDKTNEDIEEADEMDPAAPAGEQGGCRVAQNLVRKGPLEIFVETLSGKVITVHIHEAANKIRDVKAKIQDPNVIV